MRTDTHNAIVTAYYECTSEIRKVRKPTHIPNKVNTTSELIYDIPKPIKK